MKDFLIASALFVVSCLYANAEFYCQSIGKVRWSDDVEEITCLLNNSEEPNTTFIREQHQTATALNLQRNQKIEFPPENLFNLGLTELSSYDGTNCSIKTISKSNFFGLNKLQNLNLWKNQIEIIPNDALEYLKALRDLDLSFNQIKFLSGQVFIGLKDLTNLWLHGNVCINESFTDQNGIARAAAAVSAECWSTEAPRIQQTSSCTQQDSLIVNLEQQLTAKDSELETANSELKGKTEALEKTKSEAAYTLQTLTDSFKLLKSSFDEKTEKQNQRIEELNEMLQNKINELNKIQGSRGYRRFGSPVKK